MSTRSGITAASSFQVSQCQEEVRKLCEALRTLGETTGMDHWSQEIRHSYLLALDDLAALEGYLLLYRLSLQRDGDGDAKGGLPLAE